MNLLSLLALSGIRLTCPTGDTVLSAPLVPMATVITPKACKQFQSTVLSFYRRHGREFPWRKTRSSYAIVVSELMLQQTQTSRVLEYFPRFLRKFPSFRALAESPLHAVLKEWQGLGYNRRAKFLWELARVVHSRYRGRLPRDEQELRALPGVGAYTAAALRAFIWNHPEAMIETNIRTVFIQHFFRNTRRKIPDSDIYPLIEQTIWRENPRLWFYALMDYGVHLKTKHPSLHQKSAHYKRQAPFVGSRRQLRGAIIREVLARGRASTADLASALHRTPKLLRSLLDDLVAEGMLRAHRAEAGELLWRAP